MKRKIVVRFVMCFVLLMFLVSCATGPPTVQQYEFLDGAADVRLAVLRGADGYYTMGLIDEATKEKIIAVDKQVQAAGKLATAKLNEVVMLERLQTLDPTSVTPEQIAAAAKAYADAKFAFKAQWAQMTRLIDPYLMKWMQEAAAKKAGG
jgi:hypothetical protein